MIVKIKCANPECKWNGHTSENIKRMTKSDYCMGCLLTRDFKDSLHRGVVELKKPAQNFTPLTI